MLPHLPWAFCLQEQPGIQAFTLNDGLFVKSIELSHNSINAVDRENKSFVYQRELEKAVFMFFHVFTLKINVYFVLIFLHL